MNDKRINSELSQIEREARQEQYKEDELSKDWWKWPEYCDKSWEELQNVKKESICEYPIQYLQDALSGILPSQLIIIGSDTGIGKTEIANMIAFHNTLRGKEVYLFALEGAWDEVIQRERYKRIVQKAFVLNRGLYEKLSYDRFMAGSLTKEIKEVWKDNDEATLKAAYQKLHVYTRRNPLDKKTIITQLERIHDKADLVVIDHLQYFDFFTQREHSEITEIMKNVRMLTSKYKVPVVLVSHLRKKSNDRVFPDNNDFHGSSNIAKQADACIILSPVAMDENPLENQISNNLYATGIRITKARSGISQNILGVVDFDFATKKYRENYTLKLIGAYGIQDYDFSKYPKWVKAYVSR